MPQFRLSTVPWPAGTNVGAYTRTLQTQVDPSRTPPGASVATAAVATDGSLTYTLPTGDYYAVALLSGAYRYVAFSIVPSSGSGGSGGGGAVTPVRPESFGAVRDGVADDTAAIQAAIDAAVAGAIADGSYYAEVQFTAGTYQLSGALQQGGARKANAQLTFPMVATTAPKVTLVLKGASDATPFPHWQQTTPQKAGVALRTTLTGQAYSATYGLPSVIGGPTPEQGYGTTGAVFNNLLVRIDGLVIVAPSDPSVCGVDLRGIAEAVVPNLSCQAAQLPSAPVFPTNFMTGLLMPANGNNNLAEIGRYSIEGWRVGVLLNEHTNAASLGIVLCQTGIRIGGPIKHGINVGYASVEQCPVVLEYIDLSPVAFDAPGSYITIAQLDTESAPPGPFALSATISDAANKLFGEVNLAPNAGADSIVITGAGNLRINRIDTTRGAAAAPSVPASGVALRSPSWRDAAVHISGGTVTAIAVDGQTLGVTSGLVMVPSGKTITLTYSVAPTWKWTLL